MAGGPVAEGPRRTPGDADDGVGGAAVLVRDGPGGRGRRAGIALTDLGQAALERARSPVRAFNAPAALGLTPAQSAMLVELLGHVRSAMKSDA